MGDHLVFGNGVVGLYGGSFNPVHAGHMLVADTALQACQMDRVVWLVSPQNPLKVDKIANSFEQRFQAVAAHVSAPGHHPSRLEYDHGFGYSQDTIAHLQNRFPTTQFMWIMGADSLVHFHKWRDWQDIMQQLPIAVVARPGYSRAAMTSVAANRFRDMFCPNPADLASHKNGWTFIRTRMSPLSSTQLRDRRSA